MWTGNLGTSILRVQQAGENAVKDEKALEGALEALPQEGDVAAEGPPGSAVQTFLDYSLEQIEAMIDLVRGDLDRWACVVRCTGPNNMNIRVPSSKHALFASIFRLGLPCHDRPRTRSPRQVRKCLRSTPCVVV